MKAATPPLCDVRTARQALGKGQIAMAGLLGISPRAVQSYEQGWRPVPSHVQKLLGLYLFLNWRKDMYAQSPCWKVRQCSPPSRAKCPAYQFRAGELCWLVSGNMCDGRTAGSWREKLEMCRKCPVMARWLEPNGTVPTRRPGRQGVT